MVRRDPRGLRGVFAQTDIPAGTVLLELPFSTLITPANRTELSGGATSAAAGVAEPTTCDMVWALAEVLTKEMAEPINPFAALLATQAGIQIGSAEPAPAVLVPNIWNQEASDLLRRLLGPRLPPQDNYRHLDWWHRGCIAALDKNSEAFSAIDPVVAEAAALLMVTRAANVRDKRRGGDAGKSWTCMVPLYGKGMRALMILLLLLDCGELRANEFGS